VKAERLLLQRSAHQAVRQLQVDIRAGKRWVVDLDLEAFLDRVDHDRLITRLKGHVADRSLLSTNGYDASYAANAGSNGVARATGNCIDAG
jgi:retron-type reverse transcriptase